MHGLLLEMLMVAALLKKLKMKGPRLIQLPRSPILRLISLCLKFLNLITFKTMAEMCICRMKIMR